ncbi:MAG TPA: HAMP domain-containing sensor histidine kinase [Candidatus Sulfotelmatobacter sp.]|jgi:two-component system sensor histidine kinase ChvG|nr:HAMP domain-containing sensor histidine kinase [Candidatus Sulfotelmatobacter sp.]
MFRVLRLVARSLTGKFLVLVAMFLVVPLILYGRFEQADAERQAMLLRTLQMQGHLITEGLRPALGGAGGRALLDAGKAVRALAGNQVRLKLLLRPAGRGPSFFLVAANPEIEPDKLDGERDRLAATGVLERLDESCQAEIPLALHRAGIEGQDELLTSLSSLHTAAGCWVIITSYAAEDLGGAGLVRPFVEAPEMQLALVCYGAMAVLLVLLLAGMAVNLRAFVVLARRIRQGRNAGPANFAAVAGIPELMPVAREFDRMVATLAASATALREAAEDNAHAFKTPIATIVQSVEPLRPLAAGQARAEQAVTAIERALGRLETLVAEARRLDENVAELMSAKLGVVDLAALAVDWAQSYDRLNAGRGIRVTARAAGPVRVAATEESLETMLENLLDNAVDFVPSGGEVRVAVKIAAHGWASLTVEDDGPGVSPDRLEKIFRRNVSFRAEGSGGSDADAEHSGIGLAVVHRTAELLGGNARAENVAGKGLRITVTLPLA